MPEDTKSNTYKLRNMHNAGEQKITFYEVLGACPHHNVEFAEAGTTIEAVLEVALERLVDLNDRKECKENVIAITKIEEALLWLNKRTADRRKRGVEGTKND